MFRYSAEIIAHYRRVGTAQRVSTLRIPQQGEAYELDLNPTLKGVRPFAPEDAEKE